MHTVRRRLAAFACAASALVAGGTAQADRSRLDGEVVAEAGDCEIEFARERHTARGAAAEHETALQLDCGIGWRTELALALARQRGAGERTEGFDVEARTALSDRPIAGAAWSLVYGASAERAAGEHWRARAHLVALDAAWRPADAWVLEAQLGAVRERVERRSTWQRKLAVEHEISDRLEARAELEDDNRHRPLAGVELRYEFWPDVARLQLAMATRLGPLRERRVAVGVAFEF